MYREGDKVNIKKCVDILLKSESQKSEKEKDYIKGILSQCYLFKQLQVELNVQLEEKARLNNQLGDGQNSITDTILDIDVLLNRSQRNVKYLKVPKNQFLFHKGDPGDRLYIIIKGGAAIYAEREKSSVNEDLAKEKTSIKQISVLTNKILHYEHQIELKERKMQDDLISQQKLEQEQDNNSINDIDNDIKIIRQQQRNKEEILISQINTTIAELRIELTTYQKDLCSLISEDEEILKNTCTDHKELMGKYFSSQSTTGNICYFQKLKTLDAFNHLGEASIITNENRTATVMACSPHSVDKVNEQKDFQQSKRNDTTELDMEKSVLSAEEDDEDLHLLYLEAKTFIGIFSATLDQINYPLTILTKILTITSKDLIVRLSYYFKLNQYKYNTHIFVEGEDSADYIYLVKKGCVQLQRNQTQEEKDSSISNDNTKLADDIDNLKMKTGKRIQAARKQVGIAVIGEGQFFGVEDIELKKRNKYEEGSEENQKRVYKNNKRTCSAVSLTSCLIYMVSKTLLFTSSNFQLQELQRNFQAQGKVKQNFYQKQAKKNNQIQHYLEKEINRINEQPTIEKTLINLSMNHHKQMLLNTGKVSNMMGSYIKGSKDALNHQKDILPMSHVKRASTSQKHQSYSYRCNGSDSAQQYFPKGGAQAFGQKSSYGRIFGKEEINAADIAYNMMVQAENSQALNLKQNTILSVMPQSQENVKQILRAQKFYSKSKDSHNKNIRDPSRQNGNNTIFISQSSANLNSLNNINQNEKSLQKQSRMLEYKNSAMSLSEFDEIPTNSLYQFERKNNIISVKKIQSLNSIKSSTFNIPRKESIKQNSITFNTPYKLPIQPHSCNTSQIDLKYQLTDELKTLTLPKKKTRFSSSCLKRLDLNQQQIQLQKKHSVFENYQILNSFDDGDNQKIQKFIQSRKQSDNISQIPNDSFEQSVYLDQTSNLFLKDKFYQNQGDTLLQDTTTNFQSDQQSGIFQRSFEKLKQSNNLQNNEKDVQNQSNSQFKQIQNIFSPVKQTKHIDFSISPKQQELPQKKYQSKINNSSDTIETQDKNQFQSPLLNPQNQLVINTPNLSSFYNPKIKSCLIGDSKQINNKKQSISQLQISFKKSFYSQNNLEQTGINIFSDSKKYLLQTKQNFLFVGQPSQSNESKSLKSALSSSQLQSTLKQYNQKKSPSKSKLKPLLPFLSHQQQQQQQQQQYQYQYQQQQQLGESQCQYYSSPFQTRRLQPQITKLPTSSTF